MGFFTSKDEKQAKRLEESILENLKKTGNLVENFTVAFSDGVATLSGMCDTQKTRKKAIVFAELAEGVKDVKAEGLHCAEAEVKAQAAPPTPPAASAVPTASAQPTPLAAQPAPAQPAPAPQSRAVPTPEAATPQAQVYTVQSGDTLSKIAKHFYGSAGKYMLIFEANRDVLKDPNTIYPGQELRIPPAE